MNNICKTEELIQPNFFQRLLKIEPKENAFIEINNLLAVKPLKEIELEEIEGISTKYKVDIRERFIDKLKDLYLQKLKQCLSDNLLSSQDLVFLNHLKYLLLLNDSETEKMHDEVAGEIFKQHHDQVISDGKIDQKEDEFLDKLKVDLKLSTTVEESILFEGRKQFIQNRFDQMIKDKRISPAEWDDFTNVQKELRFEFKFKKEDTEFLDKLKLNWHIENGELPIVSVPINLQKNELCYFSSLVDWLENRTVTKRINYGGPTARIRIMKGVYYRAGSMGVQRVTSEELKFIDSGQLYLTNKRLIFVGNKKNSSIQLGKILSINPYSDGVGIEKDSGISPIFRLSDNADTLAMTLTRVINDFQGS
jgi:hypothetical protein